MKDRIPPVFITHAADILGDTTEGLSGPNIVKITGQYAVEYGVDVPHQGYPFEAPNKRTALRDNLVAFSPAQQFEIIRVLCDHLQVVKRNPDAIRRLKLQLITRNGVSTSFR